MHTKVSRRALLGTTLGFSLHVFAKSADDRAEAPPLTELIRQPLLVNSLYRR
jgi:hypothetical protein